jgi:hypothetical protein
MMKKLPIILTILLLTSTSLAQDWSKYVPKNKRKDIVKECTKRTGLGLYLTGQGALAILITEAAARALVSQAIDSERISNKEADAKYEELRPKDVYLFLIDAGHVSGNKFASTSGKKLFDPLARKELFLQRTDDNKQFSKGEVRENYFDINLGGIYSGSYFASMYFVTFPKITREGQPFMKSIDDKLEIQFALSGKKVVLDYKLKDIVKSLEDL